MKVSESVRHGVLMNIAGCGCLFIGPSGIGKSEIALSLIVRGHRLIADDAPHFVVNKRAEIIGYAPPAWRGKMHIREIGIVDISQQYADDSAVASQTQLNLIIELVKPNQDLNRLTAKVDEYALLGVNLPKYILTVHPGRQMHLIIETMVRQWQINAANMSTKTKRTSLSDPARGSA